MLNPTVAPEMLTTNAPEMLLGMALACSRLAAAPDEWPTEARLVIPVANSLLAGGHPDRAELLARWSTLPRVTGSRRATVTDRALELARGGQPPAAVADAAGRLTTRPELDPPLLRTIPFAIGCLGQGFLLRMWVNEATSATHSDDLSRLAAVAAARLAQDLLTRSLEDALARTAQALREDAPESLIRALRPLGPGEAVPSGDDAIGILAATVQALSQSRDWDEAVAAASSRGADQDQAVILTGALAGAIWGTGTRTDGLSPVISSSLRSLALDLVAFSHQHALDPLPPIGIQPLTGG
ncbi:MAG: ADP-ribosylglycohydrolase family protein [Candidatus Dormibacteria bacterium]